MKKIALLGIGIIIYVACFTGYVHASFKNMDKINDTYEVITVKKGETLWMIADRYNEEFEISLVKMLDRIITYNELTNSTIHPGQRINIPDLHK